jgi:hypothetical protein
MLAALSDTATAAIIAAVISLLVAIISSWATFKLQREKLRLELRTQFMAEEAIRVLLLQDNWKQRSFSIIKKTIGGFKDDELRQLLVRSGAVRFYSNDASKTEWWGLRERNMDLLIRETGSDLGDEPTSPPQFDPPPPMQGPVPRA